MTAVVLVVAVSVVLLLRARRKARQRRDVSNLPAAMTPELGAPDLRAKHRLRGSRGMM